MGLVQIVSSRDGRRNPATATTFAGRAGGSDRRGAPSCPATAARQHGRGAPRPRGPAPGRPRLPRPAAALAAVVITTAVAVIIIFASGRDSGERLRDGFHAVQARG